eukprot:scaffold288717_cov16-Prasinocladus_malaysianus.AAC.1
MERILKRRKAKQRIGKGKEHKSKVKKRTERKTHEKTSHQIGWGIGTSAVQSDHPKPLTISPVVASMSGCVCPLVETL